MREKMPYKTKSSLVRENDLAKSRINQSNSTTEQNRKNSGFLEKAAGLFFERGVQNRCDLNVRRDGNWYVLQGCVDSYRTKRKLLKLVPEVNGNQWIVDKLEVGRRRRSDR
jgi:osmotically-inducible protein OsmY